MTPERIAQTFDNLIAEGQAVLKTEFHVQYGSDYVNDHLMAGWAVNVQTLIRSVFGSASDHYARTTVLVDGSNLLTRAVALLSVLKGAKTAWDLGFAFDMKALARADVESDLIGQATTLLEGGYDRAAAVVTGAVVEERLRTIAPSWGIAVTDAKGKSLTMEPLNVELKKAGAYDGIMQKRITLLGGLRNKAAHGEPFENRSSDVESMIRDAVNICGAVNPK